MVFYYQTSLRPVHSCALRTPVIPIDAVKQSESWGRGAALSLCASKIDKKGLSESESCSLPRTNNTCWNVFSIHAASGHKLLSTELKAGGFGLLHAVSYGRISFGDNYI